MKKTPSDVVKLGVAEKKRLAARGGAAIAVVAREARDGRRPGEDPIIYGFDNRITTRP